MRLRTLKTDTRGASAVEYGLLIAGVSVAALVATVSMGGSLGGVFSTADANLSSAEAVVEDDEDLLAPPDADVPSEEEPEEEAPALGDPLVMTFSGSAARFYAYFPPSLLETDPETGRFMAGGEPLAIDWGPGAQCDAELGTNAGVWTCGYDTSGPHTVRVPAAVSTLNAFDASLVSIDSWGDAPIQSLDSAFRNTPNLVSLPGDLPSTVLYLTSTFMGAPVIPDDISTWNVSNVRSMSSLFERTGAVLPADDEDHVPNVSGAVVPDITGWRPANTQSFMYTFRNANFDQPIGAWTTGSALYMGSMFFDSSFNQPIGGWNVSRVTRMDGMFQNTHFNQDIGNWDMGEVTTIGAMFKWNEDFNQDITRWDVGNVYHAPNAFDGAIAFDQDIGRTWEPVKLQAMSQMLRATTSLTSDFSSWRPVPAVTGNIGRVFENSTAVGDLRCWDVEHLTVPGAQFSTNAPGIIPPLWGQAPLESCGLASEM